MSNRSILGATLVSISLVGALACGGNGVSLGNDGGQSGGGASAGSSAGGKGGTTVLPQGGSSAGNSAGGKGGAGGTPTAGNGGTPTGGMAGTAGTGTGGTASKGCTNPKPLDGGWEQCDGGVVHRPTPVACTFSPSDATLPPTQNQDECFKDSDCTKLPYGYCQAIGGFSPPTNLCQYGCASDNDCESGMVCVCSGEGGSRQVGVCQGSTNCKSDADCSGGNLCTDYWSQPGCPMREFACQSPQDECASDKDCPTDVLGICGYQDGHRKCMGIVCQI